MNEAQSSSRLRDERLRKLSILQEQLRIDPYLLNLEDSTPGASLPVWRTFKADRLPIREIHTLYCQLPEGTTDADRQHWVAGRIHSIRNGGMFVDLHDDSGKLQIYSDKNDGELPEELWAGDTHFLELLDKGDLLAVRGVPYRTPRGELSLRSRELWLLAKGLQPPPEIKANKRRRLGLTDTEVRYRQRYLDLMVNPEVREIFRKRSRAISTLRRFLEDRGFLEFETPILQTQAGGAAARPFETHHNALDLPLYLRIATELHLKRLLVGGFEKVFELGRVFRNEGISTRHNPEFTSLELYEAYADFEDMMRVTEELISHLAQEVCGGTKLTYQGRDLDLTPPWRRVRMDELVREVTGYDFGLETCSDEKAHSQARELQVECPASASTGEVLMAVFEAKCEDNLHNPTFVTHYPREDSPLADASPHTVEPVAKTKETGFKSRYAERFELYVCGRELANAFSESNDPRTQRQAFEDQHRQGGDLAERTDSDFLEALEYGMPPAGGLGIGIDRLLMLLTDVSSIREVILFPTMRPL